MACGSERPGLHEQLERVIERGGIAAARLDDGEKLLAGRRRKAPIRGWTARACIQFTLPRTVLISPLWAT